MKTPLLHYHTELRSPKFRNETAVVLPQQARVRTTSSFLNLRSEVLAYYATLLCHGIGFVLNLLSLISSPHRFITLHYIIIYILLCNSVEF